MICISVLYPNSPGKKFDHDYYAAKHMPMVWERLKSFGMTRYEIDRGVAGGAPGSPAPFVCIGRLYMNSLDQFQQALATEGPGIMADIPSVRPPAHPRCRTS
jgi:uncharacterized protein (TIGR02118 family)